MVISPKKILNNNAPLKVFSLVLGYMVWSIFSSGNTTTIQKEVPLCFYNIPENYLINAPETIHITLAGTRAHLYSLNIQALAIHLDARTMQQGSNPIHLTKDTLFLPDSLKLVHYTPSPCIVEITKKI